MVVFLLVLRFPHNSMSIFFTAFNMVSDQGRDKTLDKITDETQTEID